MVRIPFIKIQGVRVGSIDPTLDIGTGGAIHTSPEPSPEPVFLTNWKIVGSSEVKTLPYPDGIVLPNGYKRCEYLQSDGTAYIELPFGFDVTDEMYAKVKFNNTYNEERHIISLKDWNTDKNISSRFCFAEAYINSVNSFSSALGNVPVTLNGGFTPNALFNLSVCEVSYSNKKYTLLNEGNTFVRNLNFAILGIETSNICLLKNFDDEGTEGSIYEYRHKKGNTEYRLIPCLDSNDTPCMYDVINNQAYYNSASTGSFTYKLYPQPTEIWSCGEYNPIDGKYHILVQPLGGSIADIALDEPLRKVNDVADTIEFPSETEGKALVTRYLGSYNIGDLDITGRSEKKKGLFVINVYNRKYTQDSLLLSAKYTQIASQGSINNAVNALQDKEYCYFYSESSEYDSYAKNLYVYDTDFIDAISTEIQTALQGVELIYELATTTTELVDAPQIEEADSYSMVISQGGKAVEWSSFITNSE